MTAVVEFLISQAPVLLWLAALGVVASVVGLIWERHTRKPKPVPESIEWPGEAL